MRPKILMFLVIVPTLVVILAVVWKNKSGDAANSTTLHPGDETTASGTREQVAADVAAATRMPDLPPMPAMPHNPPPAAPAPTAEERENLIAAERELLTKAFSTPGSNSAALILADLTHAEPEVRAAAVEAAKQLGDRSLIPALTNLAVNVENYEERHAILDAAEFLALPSLAEAGTDLKKGLNTAPKKPDGTQPVKRPRPQQPNGRGSNNPPPTDPNPAPSEAPLLSPDAVPNQ